MKHPILTLSFVAFGAVTLAGAANYVDGEAGRPVAREGFDYGTNQAAGYVGEVFAIPGKVMGQVRPELQNLQAQTSGLLGPPPTAPAAGGAGPTGDLNGQQP